MRGWQKGLSCPNCGGGIRDGRLPPYCSKKCEVASGSKEYVPGYQRRLDREALRAKIAAGTAWAPPAASPAKHLVTGYPILVINDVHCPMQDAVWTEQSLVAAHKFGARTCIVNGDLIDCVAYSKYAHSEFRGKSTLEDDMDAAEKFIGLLCDTFDEVYYTLGNHTARLIRQNSGELSIQRLLKMIYNSDKFKVTEKTWMKVNDNIRVLHPRAYSQIRGKLTAELAGYHQCHLITGHHHHTASTISKDGRWQAVEVGCLANIQLMTYVQDQMNAFPEMANGFAIIMPDGKILNFNKFTHWKSFGLPNISECGLK